MQPLSSPKVETRDVGGASSSPRAGQGDMRCPSSTSETGKRQILPPPPWVPFRSSPGVLVCAHIRDGIRLLRPQFNGSSQPGPPSQSHPETN